MADPVWLADVLKAAGLKVNVLPGAYERGHGDMGDLWGVMTHHTGSDNASPQSIAFHPDLGLCSQLHLAQDGTFTVCGVGIAWHGGTGSGYGIDPNKVNSTLIGIEAANDGGGSPGFPHRSSWPDAQYNSYVTGVAAILNKLGKDQSRVIAHKEWAGAAQGKWDPGAIDMNIFRADVAREQARLKGNGPKAPSGGNVAQDNAGLALDQLAGPGTKDGKNFPGWAQLGGRTVPDVLGAIGEKLGVPGCYDTKGKK